MANKEGENTDGASVAPDGHDLAKPSMLSVAESQAARDEEADKVSNGDKKTTFGLSAFKATQSGISQASLCFGKSIQNSNFKNVARSTINTVTNHVDAMPMPKKVAMAKKKAEREEKKAKAAEEKAKREADEAAGIKVIKRKVSKWSYPDPEPLPTPKKLTVAEAMGQTRSWNTANVIANKFSINMMTTAGYQERTNVFKRMNPMAEDRGSIYPQSAFFGPDPNKLEDRFCQRKVMALNDIEFDSDEDWEEVRNLKRMPRTILNQENLRQYLTEDTLRLNLENHYWLNNNMIDKIGRMAPNMQVLSLRRMKFITNPVFAQIFKFMHSL